MTRSEKVALNSKLKGQIQMIEDFLGIKNQDAYEFVLEFLLREVEVGGFRKLSQEALKEMQHVASLYERITIHIVDNLYKDADFFKLNKYMQLSDFAILGEMIGQSRLSLLRFVEITEDGSEFTDTYFHDQAIMIDGILATHEIPFEDFADFIEMFQLYYSE